MIFIVIDYEENQPSHSYCILIFHLGALKYARKFSTAAVSDRQAFLPGLSWEVENVCPAFKRHI